MRSQSNCSLAPQLRLLEPRIRDEDAAAAGAGARPVMLVRRRVKALPLELALLASEALAELREPARQKGAAAAAVR